MSTIRQKRIADRIHLELSDLVLREVRDPRLSSLTITDVTIDRELEYAEVYVNALGAEDSKAEVMKALDHAKGFFRSEIGARVQLRRTPELRFHWDPSLEYGERISRLLDSLSSHDEEE